MNKKNSDMVHYFQELAGSIWPPNGWIGKMFSIANGIHLAKEF